MIMELVVIATSVLRLILVSAVYLLNIRGLLRLTWQPRSCVHALTTGAALLAGILYLSSWAPYVAYTLANGHWLLLGPRKHCLLQHFVSAEIGAVLLALLAVRMTYRCLVTVYRRPAPSARAVSLVTCLAWLAPQLLYDAVAATRDDTRSPDSYKFLDDLLVVPQGANATHGYRVGFMICMQALSGPVLSYYVWQYIVLVLPLAGVIVYCAARLVVAAHTRRRQVLPPEPGNKTPGGRFPFLTWSRPTVCQYGCKSNTFVDMALYYNFIWLVILRPLAMLHALYMQRTEWGSAFYMDFGSHLVLAFSAVFSPFAVTKPQAAQQDHQERLTETVNPVILDQQGKGHGVVKMAPDVCPRGDAACYRPDFRQVSLGKADSYENIKDIRELAKDASVNLKNQEKPGEESMC